MEEKIINGKIKIAGLQSENYLLKRILEQLLKIELIPKIEELE